MASEFPPLTLTLPSDLRFLEVARVFVEAVCHVGGLDSTTTNAVILATNEAAGNAIRHAHRNRAEALVQLICRFVPEGLEISVLDEGPPFNLESVPKLDPAEMRIGGRGIFLMRSLMDDLSCHPRGPEGNTLRMIKRCVVRIAEQA